MPRIAENLAIRCADEIEANVWLAAAGEYGTRPARTAAYMCALPMFGALEWLRFHAGLKQPIACRPVCRRGATRESVIALRMLGSIRGLHVSTISETRTRAGISGEVYF